MTNTTTHESDSSLDLQKSFALLSVDKDGIVTMKFGDEVTVFMNDKCPAITTDLLKIITSIKMGGDLNRNDEQDQNNEPMEPKINSLRLIAFWRQSRAKLV